MADNTLNKDQLETIDKLNKWLASGDKFFLLEASAGNGKSFTIKTWLNSFSSLKTKTIITAPTHEALEEIIKDIPGVSGCTVCSLLGYRPSATDTEAQVLVRSNAGKKVKKIDYHIVIIDEAFYVPAVLLNVIRENYNNHRFILLGDRTQLKSIGESESALIDLIPSIRYKSTLSINMRSTCEKQKQLVKDVAVQGWDYDFSKATVSKARVLCGIEDKVAKGDLDFLVIAYRNVIVDFWAKEIRQIIYGHSTDTPNQVGEEIRLTAVSNGKEGQTIRNNEVVLVSGVDVDYPDNPRFIKVIRNLGYGFDNGLEEELELDYTGEIAKAYSLAKDEQSPSLWANYHRLNMKYPRVKSKWAITAHSSQGKTSNQVYLDLTDLKREGSKELLLVAVSRSKERVKCF